MTDSIMRRHHRIAKRAEDISMTLGIISTLISIGATFLEPSSLSAFAILLGISDPPLIITLTPIIANIATIIALLAVGWMFYICKVKRLMSFI